MAPLLTVQTEPEMIIRLPRNPQTTTGPETRDLATEADLHTTPREDQSGRARTSIRIDREATLDTSRFITKTPQTTNADLESHTKI